MSLQLFGSREADQMCQSLFYPIFFQQQDIWFIQNCVNRFIKKAVYEEIVLNNTVFKETTKDDVLFNELKDVIQKLVNRLPQRQKEIFRLSRISGLSYKEIASQLEISENTVDTQIRRSLDYLRKEYERYFNR